MGRLLLLLAMLVKLAGNWQMQLFHINQIKESSKITINAHTTSGQLHQRSITTASTLSETKQDLLTWRRDLSAMLLAEQVKVLLWWRFLGLNTSTEVVLYLTHR